jgi:FkbM family methyltransferase
VSWSFRVLPVLSGVYSVARRTRLLDALWFRSLYVRAYFYYKRRLEDPFEGLVRSRPDLFRGGHVLDVGAHIGYTAALFHRALSPGFHVYAFEPEPSNLALLGETIRASGATGVVVPVGAAVGDREGEVELWRNPRHPGDHRLATAAFRGWAGMPLKTVTVPLWSLDGFLRAEGDRAPIAFIKIDVQGFEPAVCRGMEESLRRCPRAAVAVEYSPRELRAQGFDAAGLPEFFLARGFQMHVLRKDGSYESALPESLETLARGRGYLDLLMLPRPS